MSFDGNDYVLFFYGNNRQDIQGQWVFTASDDTVEAPDGANGEWTLDLIGDDLIITFLLPETDTGVPFRGVGLIAQPGGPTFVDFEQVSGPSVTEAFSEGDRAHFINWQLKTFAPGDQLIFDFDFLSETIAADDTASTLENTPVTFDVLGNDTNVSGGELEITSVTNGSHGTVTIEEDGRLTYTPNDPDFFGTDTFTYTVRDNEPVDEFGDLVIDRGTVTVTVDNVNDPVIAVDDTVELTVTALDTLTNAARTTLFGDGPGFRDNPRISYVAQSFEASDEGSLASVTFGLTFPQGRGSQDDPIFEYRMLIAELIDEEGELRPGEILFETDTLTANTGFSGNVTVETDFLVLTPGETYVVLFDAFADQDELGGAAALAVEQDTASIQAGQLFTLIAQTGTRTDHFAADWTESTLGDLGLQLAYGPLFDEDTPFTIDGADLLENDEDADPADEFSIVSVSAASAGGAVVTLNQEGNVEYDPRGAFDHLKAGETATDTFTYVVTDGNETEDTATVTMTVFGVNDAPVVTVDSLTTSDNTPAITGTLSDPDDLADVTITVVVDSQEFEATNHGDGTWTLADDTLSALADGTYDVTVTAVDSEGASHTDETSGELIIDTVAPVVTVDPLLTNDNTPTLTGTVDDPDALVTVSWAGGEFEATNNGDGTWVLDGAVLEADAGVGKDGDGGEAGGKDGGGDESGDKDNETIVKKEEEPVDVIVPKEGISKQLGDGAYDISVTAIDAAGNVGTDDTTDELIIDTLPPRVHIDPLTTDDRTPAITGTVDDVSAAISVTVDGQTFDATNHGDGTWSLADDTLSELDAGTYDVAVTATDLAGNIDSDDTADELTIEAGTQVSVGRVRDWYNEDTGRGGFTARFQLTLTEDMVQDGDVSAWLLDLNYSGDATLTRGWSQSLRAPLDFTGADGGSFSTEGKSYQRVLEVGDRINLSVQGEGGGFDLEDFEFDFEDRDPAPVIPTGADDLGVEIDASGLNDWGRGVSQRVSLKNTGDQDVTDWEVKLDLDAGELANLRIKSIWGAEVRDDGEDLFFSPVDYTEEIASGRTERFGFNADILDNSGVLWAEDDFSFV